MRDRYAPTDRRNIDDAALSLTLHVREHRLNQVVRSPEVSLERVVEVVGRRPIERLALNDSSVIDEHVDRPGRFDDAIDDGIDGLRIANVALEGHDRGTLFALECGFGPVELPSVAREQHEVGTFRSKAPRQCETKPTRAPADDDRLVAE